jgi:proteasome accessory factor B
VATRKTERLLNLVICLLDTRRFLSVQQIREAVPGYDADNEEAFRRMFERDKEDLRELGIPLEMHTDPYGEEDYGYRIAKRAYMLPDITLEPDEAAALGLAARLWQSAPLAGATGSALLKLRAAGVETPEGASALEPRIGVTEPTFEDCLAAVRDSKLIRFRYRTSGRPGDQERAVEPWGVVSWKGRWYLVGHDRLRQATRVFRLSRIVGDVAVDTKGDPITRPEDVDLRAIVSRIADGTASTTARVRVHKGTCWELRRAASRTEEGADWDVVELDYTDPERFADRVTGYGADAVVLEPEEARRAVIDRLTSLVEAR